MKTITKTFSHYEGPTWCVGLTIYAAWFALVWNHAVLPWPVIFVVGGILAAWHNSLVHESVHNINTAPKWMKMALVLPPIGVWYPYQLYARAHSIHHKDDDLTDPEFDPESYYFTETQWQGMSGLLKSILIANQTFAGRIVLGPFIVIYRLSAEVMQNLLAEDQRTIKAITLHVVSLALLFGFISGIAGMPWWLYLGCVAYPGLGLTLVRSYCEHRAADQPGHRTAIVESGPFFNLLFLYNNLHVVHHQDPSMPWYEIPAYYRAHREELIQSNGGYILNGYSEIIKNNLFTPIFDPVHPGVK